MVSDRDLLLEAVGGNHAAVDFVLLVARVVDVWDNLIDKDVAVTDDEINTAFWMLAVDLPGNSFYRSHIDDIRPVMATGITNWLIANKMQRMDRTEALEIAHVLRYSIADIIVMAVLLTSGREAAEKFGPELRLRSQRSNFAEFVESLKGVA